MELYEKDPGVTRAVAIGLIGQTLELLDAIGEEEAGALLRRAIVLLREQQGLGGVAVVS